LHLPVAQREPGRPLLNRALTGSLVAALAAAFLIGMTPSGRALAAEAGARVGFEPVQATMPEALLQGATVTAAGQGECQSRRVTLTYLVNSRPYKLVTMVHYRWKVAGTRFPSPGW
jgi:hypothetical protein